LACLTLIKTLDAGVHALDHGVATPALETELDGGGGLAFGASFLTEVVVIAVADDFR
jgi:hypothetical protein